MLHTVLWLGFAFLTSGLVLVAIDELEEWRGRMRERRSAVSPP
jgi:hypothetical protein